MKLLIPVFIFLSVSVNAGVVDILAGNNRTSTYGQRLLLIDQLRGRALTNDDRSQVLAFLLKPVNDDPLSESALATLKNDAADILLTRYSDAALHECLFAALGADNQGTIWPNYVLQKLPTIIRQSNEQEIKDRAMAYLWWVAGDGSHRDSATALIGLYSLRDYQGMVDAQELTSELARIAANPDVQILARTTALEYWARSGEAGAKTLAQEILNTYQPPALKTAAIAVYGILGNQSDEELLRPFARSQEIRIRSAAIHAIRTIHSRFGGGK